MAATKTSSRKSVPKRTPISEARKALEKVAECRGNREQIAFTVEKILAWPPHLQRMLLEQMLLDTEIELLDTEIELEQAKLDLKNHELAV